VLVVLRISPWPGQEKTPKASCTDMPKDAQQTRATCILLKGVPVITGITQNSQQGAFFPALFNSPPGEPGLHKIFSKCPFAKTIFTNGPLGKLFLKMDPKLGAGSAEVSCSALRALAMSSVTSAPSWHLLPAW
jgi:hypothetical protein